MKEYPSEFTIIFFYTSSVSVLAAIAGTFAEPDSSKWMIRPNIALVSMLCSVSGEECVVFVYVSFVSSFHGVDFYV